MDEGKKWVKLTLNLQQGVTAVITIMDNIAIMTCDKPGLMKMMFDGERNIGNARAEYDEKRDTYIERYSGWRLEKITEKMLKECKDKIIKEERS